jgi:hypothetical protein
MSCEFLQLPARSVGELFSKRNQTSLMFFFLSKVYPFTFHPSISSCQCPATQALVKYLLKRTLSICREWTICNQLHSSARLYGKSKAVFHSQPLCKLSPSFLPNHSYHFRFLQDPLKLFSCVIAATMQVLPTPQDCSHCQLNLQSFRFDWWQTLFSWGVWTPMSLQACLNCLFVSRPQSQIRHSTNCVGCHHP